MHAFYKLSWIPSLMIIVGLIFISSCKDDEKPKAKISFEAEESELYENDGTIDISIVLDRAASETIVLSYTLSGTATKLTSAGGDYDITPDGGTVTIAKGETEASIEIETFEDGAFEFDDQDEIAYETVVLTITGIVSGPGQLGETGLVHTLKIHEDDMIVVLSWEDEGDADMDLFLWYDDDGFRLIDPSVVQGGNSPGTDPEAILLLGSNPDADYAFSHVYYSGTSDDLNFSVTFINFGGTINGGTPELSFDGNYSLANINKYDEPDAEAPQMIQFATKSGLDYVDVSDIDEPETGSRRITGSFGDTNPSKIKTNVVAKRITLSPSLLKRLKK